MFLIGFQIGAKAVAEDFSTGVTTNPDIEQPKMDEEGEDKGIIPKSADLSVSSQTITPVTVFPEKNLMDQAKEELAHAQDLLSKGDTEAASDTALEAYDDFCDVHLPRRKRKPLYLLRHQAATVYMNASIAYIKDYVEKSKKTSAGIEEGLSRLEDLHDVAQNYPELTKLLNSAKEQTASIKPQ